VPPGTRALVAPLQGIGREHPLSAEKLSPVLSFYPVADWHEGLDVCRRLLEFGGMGHTMALHARDDHVVRAMALELPAFRLVVNTPSPHGSVGWTTDLTPSMSLGCGTPGGNITSDNISPMHLVNIKRLAYERRPAGHDHAAIAGAGKPQANQFAQSAVTAIASRPAQVSPSVIDRAEIARIVDRFLTAHGKTAAAAPAASNPPSSCAAPSPKPKPKPSSIPNSTVAPTPAATIASPTPAKPKPVDFVCEDDVRRALTKGQRIHVGPRTIITPAARDLGEDHEVFVRSS
jgi:acetaldehyde dehydrogenase (acetylating)